MTGSADTDGPGTEALTRNSLPSEARVRQES